MAEPETLAVDKDSTDNTQDQENEADGTPPVMPGIEIQEVNNSEETTTDQTVVPEEETPQPTAASDEKTPEVTIKRNVSFPPDSLVSGCLEPPNPWKNATGWTTQDLVKFYRKGCEANGVKPLNKVLQQLQGIEDNGERYEILSLKGEKIDLRHCESLEEIFRRVQFRCVDLEATHLDDETSVALFDMIEYYESTCKVNISFNRNISARGWQSCSRMLRKTPSLTFLDARNCDLNDRVIPILGRALRMGCFLTTLHLENTYISGRPIVVLVAALKLNETLKELFLADNKLMPTDGIQLGNLLKYNHKLQLLDIRNNPIQDIGIGHICDGLYEQNLDTGLETLVLWNNQISYLGMPAVAKALKNTENLETLNLGHNTLTNEGIHLLKEGLLQSKSLLRLGLQGTKVTCEGAVALAEYIADSPRLLRMDLRENDIKTAGLMALSLALKVNETVTRVDLDRDTKRESGMKDYADQQRRLQQDINTYLDRNRDILRAREEEKRKTIEKEMEERENVSMETQNIEHQEEMSYISTQNKIQRPMLLMVEEKSAEQLLDSPLCSQGTISSAASPILKRISTPPGELLLSPQYVPGVKAKKIFTVSRVEIQNLLSPPPTARPPATLTNSGQMLLSPNMPENILSNESLMSSNMLTSETSTLLSKDLLDGAPVQSTVISTAPETLLSAGGSQSNSLTPALLQTLLVNTTNLNNLLSPVSQGSELEHEELQMGGNSSQGADSSCEKSDESLEESTVENCEDKVTKNGANNSVIQGQFQDCENSKETNKNSSVDLHSETSSINGSSVEKSVNSAMIADQSDSVSDSCSATSSNKNEPEVNGIVTVDGNHGGNSEELVSCEQTCDAKLGTLDEKCVQSKSVKNIPKHIIQCQSNTKQDRDSGIGSLENEQWTSIESSEIPSLKENGLSNSNSSFSGQDGEKPNFHTTLTMNGLTQELASVLESIDNEPIPKQNQNAGNLAAPDEFERELDEMLASVKCGSNIPLTNSLQKTPDEILAEAHESSIPTDSN